jgi:anaerobic dimethyl sulfoxide reductase subunit B (iron-sulfur subunit)
MATQYGFFVHIDRCIDCYACEVACKQWLGIKAGTAAPRRVVEITSGKFPEVTRTFISLACMHCGDPACEAVCPTGAISKRAEDGVVVVDQDKCIGCHYCFFACPFGVPQYGDAGTMEKCDFCLDRLAEGKEPACVATCPTQALHGGTLEELARHVGEVAATKLTGATQPSLLVSP